ncbi:MAG TPA: L,D-transpeptidase [Frankiaceae bacterium]|jgi:lipoprotein-anchoring transpeptidase ErfK/SrfK|nr:L,D-transpeptidase [Frankiaceae bacterium]
MRRNVTALAAVIAVLLTTAGSTAVGRTLREGRDGPGGVMAIDPPPVLLRVSDAPAPRVAPPAPAPTRAAPARTRTVCPTLPNVSARPAALAKSVVARVKVFDRPGGKVLRVLNSPTVEGATLNTLVKERRGMWLRVQLPVRPNHAEGWVSVTDMTQYEVAYRVVVQRCAKRITVFKNGVQVWQRPAAVGKPSTPTPLGSFYVDFVAPMRYGGAYGPYLVSVAGFSNVLQQFGKNGIGQIAIHGTNKPSSVGKAASNGCVRLYNSDLVDLVSFLPEGAPVLIVD